MTKIRDYKILRDDISESGFDIGVLIVNTKFNLLSPFKDLVYEKELENIINISLVHPIFVTKTLLPELEKRDHKSAIILVNSQQGCIPAAGSLAFSSSSKFVSNFARGLNYELKNEKIDVLSFERGNLVYENDYL